MALFRSVYGHGQLPTKRADASIIGPIEMDRTAVLPLVASYKDAVGKQRAMSILRIPSGAVDQLADQNVIERINGVAAVMLGDRNHFSRSSIDAVLTGIREQARNSRSTSKAVMLTAAVDLLRPNIPWARIVKLITAGEIPVQDLANKSPDWRRNVGVRDLSAFLRLVERTSGVERNRSEEWLTIERELEPITIDEVALRLRGRVEQLSDLRARYVTAEKDLPERRLQLGAAELSITGILARLEREGETDLSRFVLSAAVVGRLRELIEVRSGVEPAYFGTPSDKCDTARLSLRIGGLQVGCNQPGDRWHLGLSAIRSNPFRR
jgi:hypothetical protein